MTPEFAAMLDWAFKIGSLVIGGMLALLFKKFDKTDQANKELSASVHALSLDLSKNYVSKPDFERALDGLFAALRRIEEKIERLDQHKG